MPHTYTNGIVTFYEDTGDGSVVVFIHGYAGDLGTWQYQVRPLVDAGFRAVRYDIRGHGRTMIAPEGYTWETYASDLGDLLDRLNVERPATESLSVDSAHLVGLSMGGGIALQFALDFPERVRSLTLVDSTLPGFAYSGETSRRVVELVETIKTDGARAAFERVWLNHPFFDGVRRHAQRFAELRETILAFQAPEQLEGASPPEYHADLTGRLSEIRAPALVDSGENDDPDFRLIADIFAANLPNARQVVMSDCWHLPPLEYPDEFNEALVSFLREVEELAAD
jgi:pimeloyl-ACP methyl ester carboxylesterase